MQSLKLQKLCGYIIYIKSVVATILATILFFSGIYHCTTINRINQEGNINIGEKAVISCVNLMSSFAGFSYIIISFVIVGLALAYLFFSRRIIYSKVYNKSLIIIALIIECICAYAFGEYLVSSMFMGFRWELIYVLTFIPMLVAQSFFTIYLLAKSLEKHKKEVNA